jgi:tRNA A37 threonylcarbamoyladenosine modification protein TsaB
MHEMEKCTQYITDIVDTYRIERICSIVGPGPFTLLRILTLTLGGISLVRGIPLVSISWWDIPRLCSIPGPYILQANVGEYVVCTEDMRETFFQIADVPAGTYWGGTVHTPDTIYAGIYSETESSMYTIHGKMRENTKIHWTDRDFCISYTYPLDPVYEYIKTAPTTDTLVPIYIKPPHITMKSV